MTMKFNSCLEVPQNTFKSSVFANMLDTLFGWRKASKCKELFNDLRRCLMALRRERSAISEQLREYIALLLMNAQQHIAFTKIEELYMNEGLIEVYEWLDNYGEFVLMSLPYIKRHRNCPNDLNEAVSTLIFASARLGDLPELQEISKLFKERYGCKFMNMAMELLPGNLVNLHVKEKICMKTVPEDAKKRLLDEITREYLDPSDFIEIECNPCLPQQQNFQVMISKSVATKTNETESKSSELHHESAMLSSITVNEDVEIHDEAVNNTEEFKSSAKKCACFVDDQDRRVFILKPLKTQSADKPSKTKSARKTQRRRSSSSSKDAIYKPPEDEIEFEVFYNNSPDLARDEFVPSFRIWLKEEETKTPQRSQKSVLSSRRHVHLKLPDCDELEAMFMALKQIHQQSREHFDL